MDRFAAERRTDYFVEAEDVEASVYGTGDEHRAVGLHTSFVEFTSDLTCSEWVVDRTHTGSTSEFLFSF